MILVLVYCFISFRSHIAIPEKVYNTTITKDKNARAKDSRLPGQNLQNQNQLPRAKETVSKVFFQGSDIL